MLETTAWQKILPAYNGYKPGHSASDVVEMTIAPPWRKKNAKQNFDGNC
jgi:hypothetical protein